jgi:hypothetical protein
MIVEERTYHLAPARGPEYLRLYEQKGVAIQTRILGNLIGYFSTEIGELNCVVSMWGYASFEDRATRRAALGRDPGWQEYLPLVIPLIQRMENRILIPAPFSPIK